MSNLEQSMVVIEENNRPFINHVYVDYLHLPDRELKVLLALKSFAWHQKSDCYPKIDTLAKLANKKRRQTQEILSSLEQKGVIRIERTSGEVNTYYITNKCLEPEKLSIKQKEPVRKSALPPCGNPHYPRAEIRTRSNISNNKKEKERPPAPKTRATLPFSITPQEREEAKARGIDIDACYKKFTERLKGRKFKRSDWETWLRNEIPPTNTRSNQNEPRCTLKFYEPGNPDYDRVHGSGEARRASDYIN